jgi:BMFP domain-containing protein YqiC
MQKPEFIDQLTERLTSALPSGLADFRADAEKTFRNILQQTFAKLDLVTREEFDVQTAVLAHTREKLETLIKQVEELEKSKK